MESKTILQVKVEDSVQAYEMFMVLMKKGPASPYPVYMVEGRFSGALPLYP